MKDQKLNVFGIELDPWEGNPQFYRLGPNNETSAVLDKRIAKVSIFQSHINDRAGWIILFWDELKPLRPFLNRLEGSLTPEEAKKEIDDFLIRMDKLRSFE